MEQLVKDYEKALDSMIKVYGIKGYREDLTVEITLNVDHTGEPQVVRGKEEFVKDILLSLYTPLHVIGLENLNIIL